jgi:hypothetical protein
MLNDDSLPLRTFFTKLTTKFIERLNAASCIHRYPFFPKKSISIHFSLTKKKKTVPINLPTEVAVFASRFWAMWGDAIPRFVVWSLEVGHR